jgi:hypothetical protein
MSNHLRHPRNVQPKDGQYFRPRSLLQYILLWQINFPLPRARAREILGAAGVASYQLRSFADAKLAEDRIENLL